LIRYTRPYPGWIFLAILLLFAQVNFDLALPDLLSQLAIAPHQRFVIPGIEDNQDASGG